MMRPSNGYSGLTRHARWSCMSFAMLALCFAASTVSTSAQTFSITLRSGQPNITYFSPPNLRCGQPLSNAPFTPEDFEAAANGSPAVVGSHPWCSQLPCDPQAKWIGLNNFLTNAKSALFAQPFTLRCKPAEGTVTLTFCWMADDFLGDRASGQYQGPNTSGVYINGHPLNISDSARDNCNNYKQVTVYVPSSILNAGTNYLYVYVRDTQCVRAGVIYSATIRGLCWNCRMQNCQQWNDCLPAAPSAVLECLPPAPNNIVGSVAGDDFVGKYTGPVNTIEWWGTVSSRAQLYRRYQITIYPDNSNCAPYMQRPFYSACVKPISVKYAGVDCQGNRVWKFTAVLTSPFNQTAGVHYWLSIAEVDAFSVRQGLVDFYWSGHRACGGAQCGCRALSASPTGGGIAFSPVVSRCDGRPMDLAWCLGWKSWWYSHLPRDLFPPHSAVRYSISIPGGAVIEEGSAEIEEIIHEDGTRELVAPISTEIPGSTVEIKVWPPNSLPRVYDWDTTNSLTERSISPTLGDVNGDGTIDDADLLIVLFNFGSGG